MRTKSKLDLSLMFQETNDLQKPEIRTESSDAKNVSQSSSHGESNESTNIDNGSQGLHNLVHFKNMFQKPDSSEMLQAPKYDKAVDDMVFSDTESQIADRDSLCDFQADFHKSAKIQNTNLFFDQMQQDTSIGQFSQKITSKSSLENIRMTCLDLQKKFEMENESKNRKFS